MNEQQDKPPEQVPLPRNSLPRNCCPVCGHEFDLVQEFNTCPTSHHPQVFEADELITSDDDYEWCQ